MAELSVLNPVADTKTEKIDLAPRLSDLSGKTIGLYWNGKSGGDVLLEQNMQLLKQRFSGLEIRNYMGAVGTGMRHATAEQVEAMVKECDAVVGATAD